MFAGSVGLEDRISDKMEAAKFGLSKAALLGAAAVVTAIFTSMCVYFYLATLLQPYQAAGVLAAVFLLVTASIHLYFSGSNSKDETLRDSNL